MTQEPTSDVGAVRGLQATALIGVKPSSNLGKKLKNITVGDVAGMSRDAFVEMSLEGVPASQRKNAQQQAEGVWQHAIQVNQILGS